MLSIIKYAKVYLNATNKNVKQITTDINWRRSLQKWYMYSCTF